MRKLWFVLVVVGACGSPTLDSTVQHPGSESQFGSIQTQTFQVHPIRPLDSVEPVSAVLIELSDPPDPRSVPYIVEGAVSQVSLNRLEDGELTSALSTRIVPSVTRAGVSGWRIRPRAPLVTGQTYSVVSTYGLHGKFTVGAPIDSYLARLWPPASDSTGSISGVYCGNSAPTEPMDVRLEGSNVRAKLFPALSDNGLRFGRCVRLDWGKTLEASVQPPPEIAQFSLDPATIPTGAIPDKPVSVICQNVEVPFGPGCVLADSGRIIVRPPAGDTLWALGWEGNSHIQRVVNGERFVIPDLGSFRTVELTILVFDVAGRSQMSRAVVELPAPSPRIIINEVMSNPVGSEPAQEWIEILNSGTLAGNLQGLTVRDSEKGAQLPSFVLHPGEYALIVRDDFNVDLPGDVPISGSVALLRLPQLGQNGLSNTGEALSLVDPSGVVLSRFPAIAAKTAGFSVARRKWWSLDDDTTAFAIHGGEGASPGALNYFDD